MATGGAPVSARLAIASHCESLSGEPPRIWPLLRCGRCGAALFGCRQCAVRGLPALYCPHEGISCRGPRIYRSCACQPEARRARRYNRPPVIVAPQRTSALVLARALRGRMRPGVTLADMIEAAGGN